MSKQQEVKAKKIVDKVMCVQDNTWIVPASEEGKYHTITKSANGFDCDCIGYQFSGNCYHIIAVKIATDPTFILSEVVQ